MFRSVAFISLAVAFLAKPSSPGRLDPAFTTIPFDKWLGEHDQAHFHWTAKVSHAELSFHQRLAAQIEIQLDGRDLESRRSDGKLLFFVQITDHDGARYQDHSSLPLDKLDANIKAATIESSQRAFFLPGAYQLSVAVLDTFTGEHSSAQAQFRVPPPQHDWLPGAWKDLPAVEFINSEESPDSWFRPEIRGRLEWAASFHAPARLTIIVNVASSSTSAASTPSSGLPAILPTLKAICETGSPSISERVRVLDLARRRAVFDQTDAQDLDWPRLKSSLADANTASIDVGSLSERHREAQVFVSQVRKLGFDNATAGGPCIVVVLTTPIAFESGEDLTPITPAGPPACRIAYIRYRSPLQDARGFGGRMGFGSAGGIGRHGSRMGAPMMTNPTRSATDQLEATLKPLRPSVFDVETPEQIARAIASIQQWLF